MISIFICLCITPVFGKSVALERTKTSFSIEEAVVRGFEQEYFSGKWISDVEIEYKDKVTSDIKVFNVAENKTRIILDNKIFNATKATSYEFSPDRKFVLFPYNKTAAYGFSEVTQYRIYSLEEKSFYNVSNSEKLQIAAWGPKNNSLIYIKSNNIYYLREINREMTAYNITTNGEFNAIFNGLSEWTYQEDILSEESSKIFWFSPNGERLMFATLYTNKVSSITFLRYGNPGEISSQYMQKIELRYPKPGATYPDWELWLVNLNEPSEKKLIRKSENGSELLYEMKWINNDNFYISIRNRVQNESKTYFCEVDLLDACQLRFEEKNEIGWINNEMIQVDENLERILRIESEPVGVLGKFRHLLLYYINGTQISLTKGYSEVTGVFHWDKNNKIVYYSAAEENDTTTSQVYAVSETNNTESICLSCQIKTPEGHACKDASASFSKLASYVYITCNGPDPAVTYLYKNRFSLGSHLHVLQDNSKLRNKLMNKLFPEVIDLSVEIPGPFKADVRILLPPNMDKSGQTKYPLLIYVYAGPEHKSVSNIFTLDWSLYFTTNRSIIYGFIDGRNTKNKGEKMLFAGYRALGTYEMEDQLAVTKYIQQNYPFVDSNRTGIWGWSYGGYAATKILELDTQNVFKCGIAVAPVADWLNYDATYIEKYMGFPVENKKNYERASVLKDVSNIRNKEYLLIHGTADDTVHYHHAMMIAKVLQRQNIHFELMSYPDENHSLVNVREHLFYTMDRFWKKCFQLGG